MVLNIPLNMESLEDAARSTRAEISAVRERTGADLRDEEGQFFRSLIDRAQAEESELLRQKQERDPMWRLDQRKKGLASRAGEPRVARPGPPQGQRGGGIAKSSSNINNNPNSRSQTNVSSTSMVNITASNSISSVGSGGYQYQQPQPVNRGVFGTSSSSVGSASIRLPLTPAYATVPTGAPPKYAEVGGGGSSTGSVPVATEAAMTPRSQGSSGAAGQSDAQMANAERRAVMGGYRFSSLPSAVNPARQRKKMSRAEREGQDRLLKVLGQEYLDEVLGPK